jgi:hypothetical protein
MTPIDDELFARIHRMRDRFDALSQRVVLTAVIRAKAGIHFAMMQKRRWMIRFRSPLRGRSSDALISVESQLYLFVIPAKAGIQFQYVVRSAQKRFCVLRTV